MEVADCETIRPAPTDPNVTEVALAKPPPEIVMAPPPLTGPVLGLTAPPRGTRPRPAGRGTGSGRPACRARWPRRNPGAAANCARLVSVKSLSPRHDVGEVGSCSRRVERGTDPAQRVEAALVGVGEEPGVGRRGDAGAAEAGPAALRSRRPPTRPTGRTGTRGPARRGSPSAPAAARVGVRLRGSAGQRLPGVARATRGVAAAAAPRLAVAAQLGRRPWQSFQTTWDDADALVSDVPPALTTSGCEPGSSTARLCGPVGREAVLGAGVARRGDHGLPLHGHPLEDLVLGLASRRRRVDASQSPQLVVTTWALSSLAMRLNRSKAWASSPFGAS